MLRLRIVFALLTLLSWAALPARARANAPLTPAAVAVWRGDLRVLDSLVVATHPRWPGDAPRGAWVGEVAALRRRIPALSEPQIVVGLQRLLAGVGDGHTQAWPFGMRRGVLLRVPLFLWQFEDGVYILDAPDSGLVGQRVIRIDGLATEEVLRRLAPCVSHDNAAHLRWAAPFYATCTDDLAAIGAGQDRTRATFTLDTGRAVTIAAEPIDPARLDITLPPPRGAPAPLYLAHRERVFRAEVLPDSTLYVQVNAMADAAAESLSRFGVQLRPLLERHRRLVVDLRLNHGGEASAADELMKTLLAFDTRGGRLAVVVGRMTFSAAVTFAARIDQWTSAVFVGEPTGGRPNHFGNERPFRLPYSGLRGTIASGLNQPVSARDDRAAIAPDVAVPLRAADYFTGHDPALDAACAAVRAE